MFTSPEFVVSWGTQDGRLDFFIKNMNWGIELLRDGIGSGSICLGLCAGGNTSPWWRSNMNQWSILDCRPRCPERDSCANVHTLCADINWRSETFWEIEVRRSTRLSLIPLAVRAMAMFIARTSLVGCRIPISGLTPCTG